MNTKTVLIIFLVILALVGISSFLFLSGFFEKTSEIEKPPVVIGDKKEEVTLSEQELQKKVSDAVKTSDFSSCESITDEFYNIVCINNIALNLAKETGEISHCQKIDGKLMSVTDCEGEVISLLSRSSSDACSELEGDAKKQCTNNFYSQDALKNGNIEACDNISGKEQIDSCRNNYFVNKEFFGNEQNFSCDLFEGEDIVSDCEYIKQEISQGETLNDLSCVNLKTSIFLHYCI